jgi:hypothetical protein
LSATDEGQAKQQRRLGQRVWLAVLTLVPAAIAEEVTPAGPPGQPTLADLLDRIGDEIGRAFLWLERSLGLRPRDWPADRD